MVLVFLGNLQFEASKFETRTMPTPTMKGKEMIYWIRVETSDRRLVTDLERFLNGSSQFIELRVPSSFIAARTELESYIPLTPQYSAGRIHPKKSDNNDDGDGSPSEKDEAGSVRAKKNWHLEGDDEKLQDRHSLVQDAEEGAAAASSEAQGDQPSANRPAESHGPSSGEEKYTLEIILRRNIPDEQTSKTQSPYG